MAYQALQRFVAKRMVSKAVVREAKEELDELIGDLQGLADELDDACCEWEDGDDPETRAEGKEHLEEVASALEELLATAAGRACGMVVMASGVGS